MTKLEAVKELMKLDHCYLYPKGIKELGEPFGYYRTTMTPNQPNHHKGLNCKGYKEGEMVEGIDASVMAMDLCDVEKVKYQEFFGRGSQLAHCCTVLIKHLERKNEKTKTTQKS